MPPLALALRFPLGNETGISPARRLSPHVSVTSSTRDTSAVKNTVRTCASRARRCGRLLVNVLPWPLSRSADNLPLHRQVSVTPRIVCAIPLTLLSFTIPVPVTTAASISDPAELAASLIGRPYVWGAEGPGTFDCSGLTQYVYREFGVELPRRAISQSRAGDAAYGRLRRGDLVFFSTDARRALVTHVGIYEGSGLMIEASKRYGRVRRDSLNDRYWVDRFMFARRIAAGGHVSNPPARAKRPQPRGNGRRTAQRVLAHIADILLRRPGR